MMISLWRHDTLLIYKFVNSKTCYLWLITVATKLSTSHKCRRCQEEMWRMFLILRVRLRQIRDMCVRNYGCDKWGLKRFGTFFQMSFFNYEWIIITSPTSIAKFCEMFHLCGSKWNVYCMYAVVYSASLILDYCN